MSDPKSRKLSNLSFRDFGRLASDPELSKYERIGFFDRFREGKEELIFREIIRLMPSLLDSGKRIMDIGPGCSDLPVMLLELCAKQGHEIWLLDNQEMLDLLPENEKFHKWDLEYPSFSEAQLTELEGSLDTIICYSVFHYIFPVTPVHRFVDTSLRLLASGGSMLIADIPNFDKKNRFFASAEGRAFHKANQQDDSEPVLDTNTLHPDWIDDAVLAGIMQRVRSSGSEAYLLPQHPELPFANRRDDLLIIKR